MSMSEESLEYYVNKLSQMRDEGLSLHDPSFGDKFAIHCLKMVTLLQEENSLGRAIARELSLIIDFEDTEAVEQDLFAAVNDIEQDLEENLRGFSGLLDLILEDTRIRRDPFAKLVVIEDFDKTIASSFGELLEALEALHDLEDAFDLNCPKAATALFLASLKNILRDLFNIDDRAALDAMNEWLLGRIKNHVIEKLFLHTVALRAQSLVEFDISVYDPDLVVVLLCLRSVDQNPLDREEATFIDRLLCSMGMLGIKPLVEAGFLELEECARSEMQNNISPKILLAT